MKFGLFLIVLFGVMPFAAGAVDLESPIRPTVTYVDSHVHYVRFGITPHLLAQQETGGADYYEVTYGPDSDFPEQNIVTVAGDASTFVVKGLRSGMRYYVRVVAVYKNGDHSWAVTTSGYTKPNRPRFLRTRHRRPTDVVLVWEKAYRNPLWTRYDLEVYKVEGKGEADVLVLTDYVMDDDITLNPLEANTTYRYRLRAQLLNFPQAFSPWSDFRTFHTPSVAAKNK